MIPFAPQLRRHLVPVDPETGDTFQVFEVGDDVSGPFGDLGVRAQVAGAPFVSETLRDLPAPARAALTDRAAAVLLMRRWFHGENWDPSLFDPRQRATVVRYRAGVPRALFVLRRYLDSSLEWLLTMGERTPSDTPILRLALWDCGVRHWHSHLGEPTQAPFLQRMGWTCMECSCFPNRTPARVLADPTLQYSHWVLNLTERPVWPADHPIKFNYPPGQDPEEHDVTTLP